MKLVTSTNDASHSGIFCYSWKHFPACLSPFEFFLPTFLLAYVPKMRNSLMHGRWKLICFSNCFAAWRAFERLPTENILSSLGEWNSQWFSCLLKNQILWCIIGVFIGFKWWLKSLKMSKYWSCSAQNGWNRNQSSVLLFRRQICFILSQLINNQFRYATFMASLELHRPAKSCGLCFLKGELFY